MRFLDTTFLVDLLAEYPKATRLAERLRALRTGPPPYLPVARASRFLPAERAATFSDGVIASQPQL